MGRQSRRKRAGLGCLGFEVIEAEEKVTPTLSSRRVWIRRGGGPMESAYRSRRRQPLPFCPSPLPTSTAFSAFSGPLPYASPSLSVCVSRFVHFPHSSFSCLLSLHFPAFVHLAFVCSCRFLPLLYAGASWAAIPSLCSHAGSAPLGVVPTSLSHLASRAIFTPG